MPQEHTLERMRAVMRRSLNDVPDRNWDTLEAQDELDGLGFDSLTVLDLIYDLQQEFGLEADIRDLAGLRTVGELADYLENGAPR